MPHLHALVDEAVLIAHAATLSTAHQYVIHNGCGDIRNVVEEVIDMPGEVAFFARQVSSIEPPETRLGVEFVLDTGMHFTQRGAAVTLALDIYDRIVQGIDVAWRLPEQWGFWFRCKGDFDDIFVSPATYQKLHLDRHMHAKSA